MPEPSVANVRRETTICDHQDARRLHGCGERGTGAQHLIATINIVENVHGKDEVELAVYVLGLDIDRLDTNLGQTFAPRAGALTGIARNIARDYFAAAVRELPGEDSIVATKLQSAAPVWTPEAIDFGENLGIALLLELRVVIPSASDADLIKHSGCIRKPAAARYRPQVARLPITLPQTLCNSADRTQMHSV